MLQPDIQHGLMEGDRPFRYRQRLFRLAIVNQQAGDLFQTGHEGGDECLRMKAGQGFKPGQA